MTVIPQLFEFPLKATKVTYKGQKVICQIKALRTNEIKHRMCLASRNIADALYNCYKVAGYLSTEQYQLLLNMFLTYVLYDRIDKKEFNS